MHHLIIEEASLEIVPRKYWSSAEAKRLQDRFGIPPSEQILDRNYHNKIVASLVEDQMKRGRPDVVHFALLDATSVPIFRHGMLKVLVRTRDNLLIEINQTTRLPRTLQRFCGVFAKLLRGEAIDEETNLFSIEKNASISRVLSTRKIESVVTLTEDGSQASLRALVNKYSSNQNIAWIVGGFPRGQFKPEILEASDYTLSISPEPLPAHVVTARVCYELELALIGREIN